MNTYELDGEVVDSIELKCLIVSRGIKVRREVYRHFSPQGRLSLNPLACNCILLSDGTTIQMIDTGFHLKNRIEGILWDKLKPIHASSQGKSDLTLGIDSGRPALLYRGQFIDHVVLPPPTDFYKRTTAAGTPFAGNAVLQGLDWVVFQSLWPCEYAASGKPCQFCFNGADIESLGRRERPLPQPLKPSDVAEIADYGLKNAGCTSVLLSGGCTFSGTLEEKYITAYLEAIHKRIPKISGEVALCITPPVKKNMIDQYYQLGVDRISCSLEVWNESLARVVTPGKIQFTTRQRQLETLEYIARKFGPGKAASNFIIGLEPLESLQKGAEYLAQRGILPTASIWIPMEKTVLGAMKVPNLDFYRRVKDCFSQLYEKYNLKPTETTGMNICMGQDIWNYAVSEG